MCILAECLKLNHSIVRWTATKQICPAIYVCILNLVFSAYQSDETIFLIWFKILISVDLTCDMGLTFIWLAWSAGFNFFWNRTLQDAALLLLFWDYLYRLCIVMCTLFNLRMKLGVIIQEQWTTFILSCIQKNIILVYI